MRWGTNEMGNQWDGGPMRWGTNDVHPCYHSEILLAATTGRHSAAAGVTADTRSASFSTGIPKWRDLFKSRLWLLCSQTFLVSCSFVLWYLGTNVSESNPTAYGWRNHMSMLRSKIVQSNLYSLIILLQNTCKRHTSKWHTIVHLLWQGRKCTLENYSLIYTLYLCCHAICDILLW